MTARMAVEQSSLLQVLSSVAGSAALALRYGVLADELLDVLARTDLSPTQTTILSGMVGARQLRGFSSTELTCSVMGALVDRRIEYLPLSICVSRRFLAGSMLSQVDRDVFGKNDVNVHEFGSTDFVALIALTDERVLQSWTLNEGGTILPASLLALDVKSARSVVIYDKYFGVYALRVIEEVLAAARAGGSALDIDVLILCGRGPARGLTEGAVRAALEPHLIAPGKLVICKSSRPTGSALDMHDRYIQIDQRVTFEFSAGIGMFYEWNGTSNRAGSIKKSDIVDAYSAADVIRDDNGTSVRIRY
jgi:hypothetical protein